MTEVETGRMLLSHNFDISNDIFPELSLEEFTQVFIDGLSQYDGVRCRQLSHPHWMVEIVFFKNKFSSLQVGELCADALVNKRIAQKNQDNSIPDILILGGLKTTPPNGSSPDTLQPGEWGVDVVETTSAEDFLTALGWEEKTAGKTIDNVFKVERVTYP
ncbi:DUF2656 domain-containing protein [Crocosphaera sp. Alani8]|uniref:DUF2656 domain-containing protein n=1 Tax=Crocosphaera sp. Alani8 TaxID=3038952 RepID=UPI00313CA2F8